MTVEPFAAVLLASGYWDTQAGDPNLAPGAGKYRADNWAAPALVAIASTDKDGYDRHAGLLTIAPGTAIIEQGANNSQNYQQWTVTGAVTDNGTWIKVPVEVAASGSAFTAPGSNVSYLLQALQLAPPGQPPEAGGAGWQAWAPPLNPPTAGGLPYDQAQAIADAFWADSPHLCAALQWEAYAATLAPTPAVASVSTGAQSVSYSPAAPQGEFGLAMQRAAWHRAFLADQLVSVEMTGPRDRALAGAYPWGWWPYG